MQERHRSVRRWFGLAVTSLVVAGCTTAGDAASQAREDAAVASASSALGDAIFGLGILPGLEPVYYNGRYEDYLQSGYEGLWVMASDLKHQLKDLSVAEIKQSSKKSAADWFHSMFGFGYDYEHFFCEDYNFSPAGMWAVAARSKVDEYRNAIALVNTRADALDRAIAAHPEAAAPYLTAAEGRSRAVEVDAQVDSQVARWRATIDAAVKLREDTRKVYDQGRSIYARAGVKIKACNDAEWALGL